MKSSFNRRHMVLGTAGLGLSAAIGAPSRAFAQGTATPVAATGSNTEISFWTSFGSGVDGDESNRLIKEFNEQNNGVQVKVNIIPSYEEIAQGLITGLQTGDVPDCTILSDVWWFRFYLAKALADMTPYITNAGDYVPTLFKDYTRNGAQYGVPFARSMPMFYYNVDMAKKAGLADDAFATWSGFRKAAPELVKTGGAKAAIGFGNAGKYGAWVLQGAVWAFGGHYSDEDFNILLEKDECLAASEFFREFVTSGNAKAVPDPEKDFLTGANATVIAGSGAIGNFAQAAQFEFKTMMMPEEKQFGACTGGAGLSILANASEEKKKAAATFIDWMTNAANTAKWGIVTGYTPVRTSALEGKEFSDFLGKNPNNQTAIDQLAKTTPQDTARVFIPNGDGIIGSGWDQILVKNRPAKDAWAETASTLNDEKQPVLEALKELEG